MESIHTGSLLLVAVSAITLHELVLRRTEVDHLTLAVIATSSIVYWIFAYYTSLFAATSVALSFWVPLWLYIGCYRAFFHPLNEYPGPFGAKLSRWWTIKQTWGSSLRFHRVQQNLQKKYGDYVRTGMQVPGSARPPRLSC